MTIHGCIPLVASARGWQRRVPIAHLVRGTLSGTPEAGLAELMTDEEWAQYIAITNHIRGHL